MGGLSPKRLGTAPLGRVSARKSNVASAAVSFFCPLLLPLCLPNVAGPSPALSHSTTALPLPLHSVGATRPAEQSRTGRARQRAPLGSAGGEGGCND
ncbi:hypothetical protein NDU88_003827 [Pleurodeles waltl]|uniref:Uncharacterized protein n=1 Tax=Pleurodeles waltl TaxID=8319 RepID=A0AAV7LI19_PLEWA|nr:hypothetical protein NDU88_003827 [Pleurodeles waltl]